MKSLSIILLSLLSSLSIVGATIKGHVIDKHGNLIEGANCICFTLPDSTFHSISITDETGLFNIEDPETDWYLDISRPGYRPFRISEKEYSRLKKLNLPINLVLNSKATDLQEVEVVANKGLISMKNGILSFTNLNEIIQNQVISSAFDLLVALPLITSLDGSNITLTGAPLGSVIYINGKQSQMDISTLIDYLKSIPPEMVQNVEIVYSPSPKWRTRNSIINVKLKQLTPYTSNGQIKASGSWRQALTGNLGSSFFLSIPKLDINTGYYFKSGEGVNKEVLSSHHTVGAEVTDIENIAKSHTDANTHNVFALVNFKINKENDISINYNGQFSPKSNNDTYSQNSVYGLFDSNQKSDNWLNAVSLNYSSKKDIVAGIDYSNYFATRNQEIFKNSYTENSVLIGSSFQRVNRIKTYFDMTTSVGREWILSFGLAYEFNRNYNRLANTSDDTNMESDYVTTKIREHIAAAYVGVQKSFLEKKLSLSAFLKGEIYKMGGYKKMQLLPSATITYTPSPLHVFQASYQRFRQYPSLWQRQDYKSYTNPYLLNEGNPALKPATHNVASLLYLFKQKYILTLGYYYTSDFFLTQSFQSQDALVLISKPYNINISSAYDLTMTIPLNIGKIVSSTVSINITSERFKSSDWHHLAFDKSKLGGGIMMENLITISRKPKISIKITGMYKLPSIVGLWERGDAWLLNAGISGTFLKDKLIVSFDGFDLLQSLYPEKKIRLDKQWMNLHDNYYSRTLSLNISYNFRGYRNKKIKSFDTSRYGFE